MEYKDKLEELDKRIAALEKIEKRRKFWNRVDLGFKLIGVIILIVIFYKAYTFVQTYKQKIDQIQNVQDKLNTTENFLQEQLDKINKYNIFN